MTLGTFIKNARLAKGLSQMDLSILCEVSQQQISHIENGESIPHLSTLKSLCIHLDTDLNEVSEKYGYNNSSTENISIGTTIRNARIAKGLSQQAFGDACGLSKQYISLIEKDIIVNPRFTTLKKICAALDIDFNDVLKNFVYIKVEDSGEELISLGNFIKAARFTKMYNQQDLSKMSGVSTSQISNLEKDKYIPHLSTLKKICAALDIDYDEAVEIRDKSLYSRLS